MSYTPLADPFTIQFSKEGTAYTAQVAYVKSDASCANLFRVSITNPPGTEPFCLKEKPMNSEGYENLVWIDENNKVDMLYQFIGDEIENHLRKDLGVILMNSPVGDKDQSGARDDHE